MNNLFLLLYQHVVKQSCQFFTICGKYSSQSIRFFLKYMLLGLRPLLGVAHCRFEVSCTKYALAQLEQKNIIKALWHISKRLIKCNPLYKGEDVWQNLQ